MLGQNILYPIQSQDTQETAGISRYIDLLYRLSAARLSICAEPLMLVWANLSSLASPWPPWIP